MDDLTVSFFTYGRVCFFEINEKPREVLLKFCSTNPSFIELSRIEDADMVHWFSIFHIRNVRPITPTMFKVRMRYYHDNFYLSCSTEKETKFVMMQFQNLIGFAQSIPYSEFSLKNMIRFCLYSTGMANLDNRYTRQDISTLVKHLHVFLSPEEYTRVMKHCVGPALEVTNQEIRRLFEVLMIKEELIGVFKSLLQLPDDERIMHRRLSLMAFYEYLSIEDDPDFSLESLRKFFGQTANTNILLPYREDIDEITFAQFCQFHFSNLNRIDDMTQLRRNKISDLPLTDCYIQSCFDPAMKLGSLDELTSLEGLEQAIEQGYRYINLSFSNGNDGRPILSTSVINPEPIPAEECFKMIMETAFKKSDSPFIISVQTFCSRKQRDVLADQLAKCFQGAVYYVPSSAFHLSSLPPIKMLRNKVLVQYVAKYPSFSADDANDFRVQIREPLDTLTTIFEEPYQELNLKTVYGLFRWKESKFKQMIHNEEAANRMREFTRHHLVCVHPNARTHFNPDVHPAMEAGVQFWMLDNKVRDELSFFQKILFLRNNGCGIVSKPRWLLDDQPVKEIQSAVRLSIMSSQILEFFKGSALQIVYPFVIVRVIGHETDVAQNKVYRTSIYQNNLLHSVYDGVKCDFTFCHPDASFIQIQVVDAKTEKMVRRSLVSPDYLKKGLKVVRLYDTENYFDGFSFLMVYVEKPEVERR